MLLSDATLTRARETLEQLHGTTATHSRLAETIGSSGDIVRAWTSLGSIACRVETDMWNMSSRVVAGTDPSDRPVYDCTVFAAHDADIRLGDRLTLASGLVLSVVQASRGQSQALVSVYHCSEVS